MGVSKASHLRRTAVVDQPQRQTDTRVRPRDPRRSGFLFSPDPRPGAAAPPTRALDCSPSATAANRKFRCRGFVTRGHSASTRGPGPWLVTQGNRGLTLYGHPAQPHRGPMVRMHVFYRPTRPELSRADPILRFRSDGTDRSGSTRVSSGHRGSTAVEAESAKRRPAGRPEDAPTFRPSVATVTANCRRRLGDIAPRPAPGPAHSPRNCGARFSRKAAIASVWSAVVNNRRWASPSSSARAFTAAASRTNALISR